jgi:hypothetical protein
MPNLERPGGKLDTKFEIGRSFGMNLEGDCHEVKVAPILELFIIFYMSLEGVCLELELYTQFPYMLIPNFEVT